MEEKKLSNKKSGHEKMIVWQMIDKLDILTQDILKQIPKNEFKTRSQIDSASDSIGANFIEGYYSGSLNEYIRFSRYSRRSCGELQERVRRVFRKGYIDQNILDKFNDVCIKTGYLIDRLLISLERKRAEKV